MRRNLFLIAAVAVALAGCRAQKVKPAAERTLETTTFPHSKHVDAVDCTGCHEDIAKAQRLGEYRAPTVAKCEECHDRAKPEDAKKYSPPARERRDVYTVRFDHAQHLARIQEKSEAAKCGRCHKVLPEPGDTRRVTPPMAACTDCHHHQQEVAEARCTPCHVSLKRFPMKPIAQFVEFSHTGNFVREHGRLAKNSAETCAQCHDQTFCANCHATATLPLRPEVKFPENVTSDFIHRGDYMSRHHYDVERDPASCRKCHGSRFCESCHQVQNIGPGVPNARNPHPPGWVRRGGPQFHGDAARNNIVSCAGCHDQGAGANCVGCHQSGGPGAAGGIGGNPHPPGWRSRHDRGDIAKNSMCRVCHPNG